MSNYVGFYPKFVSLTTLLKKEVHRFLRIWPQTLLPPAITMSLYFLIFGKFIGSQINNIDGFTYIQFIVPGLIMMSIMTSAYNNTASSFFLTKFNRSIDELLVSPMPTMLILLGFMLGGMLRGLMVGTAVLVISLLFTHVPLTHPSIVFLMSVLAAMVFSLGGLINAIYAKRFDDISFIPVFVLTPLTYLGGVFYSVDQLPPMWRSISMFNPILNMVDSFRFGVLGISDLSLWHGFGLVGGFFLILFFWARSLLMRGIGIKV